MASLMDALKPQLTGQATEKPELGETEQVQRLMRAKTGKATEPGAGPRQSAIAEKMAARQSELGRQELAGKGEILAGQQEAQAADITQREQQQQRQAQQAVEAQQQQFQLQSDAMLNQFLQGEKRLQTQQDLADLEQVGAGLRLQNQQYVDTLRQEGQKARLDDAINFKSQLAQQAFADSQDLISSDYAFRAVVEADDREFEKELQEISALDALEMVKRDIESSKTAGRWTAATAAGSAVLGKMAEK